MTSVCLSVHGGVSRPTPGGQIGGSGWGFPGPHPGGRLGGLAGGEGLQAHTQGGFQAHTQGGCPGPGLGGIPACTEADTPPQQTATAVGGTHPTGNAFLLVYEFTENVAYFHVHTFIRIKLTFS